MISYGPVHDFPVFYQNGTWPWQHFVQITPHANSRDKS